MYLFIDQKETHSPSPNTLTNTALPQMSASITQLNIYRSIHLSVCQLYLILQLLREVLSLIQGKPGDKLCGQDVAAAQLIDHLWDIEERMILQ